VKFPIGTSEAIDGAWNAPYQACRLPGRSHVAISGDAPSLHEEEEKISNVKERMHWAQLLIGLWVLGECGLKGMLVIGRAVGLVAATSPVGFHCIQPNLRRHAEFA
jgi:hypothetical protein